MQPLFIIRYSLNSENAMFTASELLERINSHIAELQFTRTPQGLYAPVTYVLSMGGKRIRPVLMLMAYNLYQEDITRIFNPATGIEVYHNYTLLHDDLMDMQTVAVARRQYIKSGMTMPPLFRGMQCLY